MEQTTETQLRETIGELLDALGVQATIDSVEEHERSILVRVSSEESSRLIGQRGETLRALQHLVGSMLRRASGEAVYVTIDVGGYLERQEQKLREIARSMAEEVKSSGAEKQLRPMNAAQRRIVHMELAEIEGIVTESVGTGQDRRIVIKPA
jgi:spoIIIJ-associated protein